MKYGEFKTLVDGFLGKKKLTTQIPSFIEAAKLNIQMKHDFAFTRTVVTVGYPSTTGTGVPLPSDFKIFIGDFPVEIVTGETRMPIPLTNEERERQSMARTSAASITADYQVQTISNIVRSPIRAYITMGANLPTLFTVPEQLSHTLKVYYYKWLNPYTNDNEEDYLLLRGFNYLLWETIKVANVYLFEDDKIPLNVKLFEDSFNTFTQFDDALRHSHSPIEV